MRVTRGQNLFVMEASMTIRKDANRILFGEREWEEEVFMAEILDMNLLSIR